MAKEIASCVSGVNECCRKPHATAWISPCHCLHTAYPLVFFWLICKKWSKYSLRRIRVHWGLHWSALNIPAAYHLKSGNMKMTISERWSNPLCFRSDNDIFQWLASHLLKIDLFFVSPIKRKSRNSLACWNITNKQNHTQSQRIHTWSRKRMHCIASLNRKRK